MPPSWRLISLLGFLAGCANVPEDVAHPVLWWVGLTAGGALLAAAIWLLDGVWRRHSRREERRDDRANSSTQPKR